MLGTNLMCGEEALRLRAIGIIGYMGRVDLVPKSMVTALQKYTPSTMSF